MKSEGSPKNLYEISTNVFTFSFEGLESTESVLLRPLKN